MVRWISTLFVWTRHSIIFLVSTLGVLYISNVLQSIAYPITLDLPSAVTNALPGDRCQYSAIANAWTRFGEDLSFDREAVAATLAPYAAASLNAYDGRLLTAPFQAELPKSVPGPFALGLLNPTWTFVGRDERPMGYVADIYKRETPTSLIYVVAFRGTDSVLPGIWAPDDTVANASWFTRLLNPFDQYASARQTIRDVMTKMSTEIDGRTHLIIATGHSLGGALARHTSSFAPCTVAVTFNASFVTNRQILAQLRTNPLIEVFEDFDILSTLKHRFFGRPTADQITEFYQWYNFNLLDSKKADQHEMMRFASGMSRMALECQIEAEQGTRRCGVQRFPTPHILYCQSDLVGAAADIACIQTKFLAGGPGP